MNPDFWRGKRVFLTGHTGFKGSWLALWLQHLGADVFGFALPATNRPSLFEEAEVSSGLHSMVGDIRDLGLLQNAMQSAKPDIVIHMAAQALVRNAYQDPVGTYATNVMGTVHCLESMRKVPSVKAAVVVTSDKCYENREWVWGYRENDPMGGHDPYSSSKGCAELVAASYRASYFQNSASVQSGVAVATARAGNVIGGGDWSADRLIPDILRAIEAGKPVVLRNPGAIRPWQHVLEPLRGYLMLAQRLYANGSEYAEGWNFGPAHQDTQNVAWIASALSQQWGASTQWIPDPLVTPHEAAHLRLDTTKSLAALQWKPQLNLEDALGLVVDWHKKRLEGANVRTLTLQQIHNYQNSLPPPPVPVPHSQSNSKGHP